MSIDIDPNRLSTYLEGKYDRYKTANTKFKKALPKVIRAANIVTTIAALAAGILADRYNTSIATESAPKAQATTVDASDEISASLISSYPVYTGRNIKSTRIIMDGIQSDIACVPLTEAEALTKKIPQVTVDTDGDGTLDTTFLTEQDAACYIKPFDQNPSNSIWTNLFGIKFELTDGTIVTQMDIENPDGTLRNVLTYTEKQNVKTLELTPLVNYPTRLNWDGATPIEIYSVTSSAQGLFEDISFENNSPTNNPQEGAPTSVAEKPKLEIDFYPVSETTLDPNYTDLDSGTKVNMPTSIIVDKHLAEASKSTMHVTAVKIRESFVSDENGEDGTASIHHMVMDAYYDTYKFNSGTLSKAEYLESVSNKSFMETAITVNNAYNIDTPDKPKERTNYTFFPTITTIIYVNPAYDPTADIKGNATFHVKNFDPITSTGELQIWIPIDPIYGMDGKMAVAKLGNALANLSHIAGSDGIDGTYYKIALGPKTSVTVPGNPPIVVENVYAAAFTVEPTNWSDSLIP